MNFVNGFYNVTPLIPCIQLQGKELVGIEVGVQRAESLCTLLQNCPNIVKLYGVDNWKPYIEELHEERFTINEEDNDLAKLIAYHNIKWSGFATKVEILEQDSVQAANTFDNNFFDFIFLDSYNNQEECIRDLETWFPKLKHNGLFCGHDSSSIKVLNSIVEFRKDKGIVSPLSVFNDTWCWKKL
jgi:hypothetical protein